MECKGRIELSRELSFTQAQTLRKLFETSKRPICLEVTGDGRGLQWNKRDAFGLEYMLLEITKQLSNWGIQATGVLHIIEPQRVSYDVVVLSNRVRIWQDGKIKYVQQ